jgi:hypothetical protein
VVDGTFGGGLWEEFSFLVIVLRPGAEEPVVGKGPMKSLVRRLGISLEQHGCLLEPGNRNVGDCDTKACRGLSGCATSGRH